MDAATRRLVFHRAGEQCEYCGLNQSDDPFAAFQVEHVIPRQHGGTDDPSNLALACWYCNARKGPNLAAIDPETRLVVRLFNPREERWYDHFMREGVLIVGLTPEGRATARLLGMNLVERLAYRAELE